MTTRRYSRLPGTIHRTIRQILTTALRNSVNPSPSPSPSLRRKRLGVGRDRTLKEIQRKKNTRRPVGTSRRPPKSGYATLIAMKTKKMCHERNLCARWFDGVLHPKSNTYEERADGRC